MPSRAVPSDYASDLALARSMADDADAISFARFGAADLVVESKPDLTPVSDADTAVERALRARLAQARPDDAIVGEEFGSDGAGSDAIGSDAIIERRWVIDPIDGTKNYVRGVPVWATLISLLEGDDVVVGVVSAPALGRRWWAARGSGAWVSLFGGEPRQLSVSRVSRLEDASFSYASLGSAGEGWGPRRAAFIALLDRFWRTRAYGDFWSYMLVAEGAIDAAAEAELALWDMGALAPIVTEAGGRFTGVNGIDGIHQGNAVATNGLLHDAVVNALAASAD